MSEDKSQNTPESHFEDFLTYRGLWDKPSDVIGLLREDYMEGRDDEKQSQSVSGSLFADMGMQEVKLPSIMTK